MASSSSSSSSNDDEIISVLVASAQSVAKVFVIGAVGFLAVRFPQQAPLLPASSVSVVARFAFHILVLSLIYSTTAVSVSPDNLTQYWFVVTAAVVVLAVSYITATVLGGGGGHRNNNNNDNKWCSPSYYYYYCCCNFLSIANPQDFVALRIAATFPNIVALPILIFPSLCEHAVVYENFLVNKGNNKDSSGDASTAATDTAAADPLQLSLQCAADANAIIFCYFFTWSLLFYSLGHPQLIAAAKQRARQSSVTTTTTLQQEQQQNAITSQGNDDKSGNRDTICSCSSSSNNNNNVQHCVTDKPCLENIEDGGHAEDLEDDSATIMVDGTHHPSSSIDDCSNNNNNNLSNNNDTSSMTASTAVKTAATPTCMQNMVHALHQTLTSPGFLALALGAITGCIPPLRDALFEPGGPLRFLGDAIETLGRASSPMSTMVVAASLMPPKNNGLVNNSNNNSSSSSSSSSIHSSGGDASSVENRYEAEDKEMVLSNRHNSSDQSQTLPAENPIMSDPNFGPHQPLPHDRRRQQQARRRHSSLYRLGDSMRRSSANLMAHVKQQVRRSNPEQRRLLVWFTLSRLVLSPAIVVGILLGLNYGTTLLDSVPPLAQLVVIVNASLPGALIVVVLLKSQPSLSESASAVARVYLPTYLISIITIAAWTAVGLWITMPPSSSSSSE